MVGDGDGVGTKGGNAYQDRNAIMNPKVEKMNMRPCLSTGLRRGMVRALEVMGCRAGAVQSVWSFMLNAVGVTPAQHRSGAVNYLVFGGGEYGKSNLGGGIGQEFLVSKLQQKVEVAVRCLCHAKCNWGHVSCSPVCASILELQ